MGRADVEFSGFFRGEYESVLRTVALMLGNREAAEGVTQEAFYSAFVRWRRVSGYDKPGAWVRRVAIRLAGRQSRRSALRVAQEPPVESSEPSIDSEVRAALASLPMGQRSVVVLHYYQDMAVREIAELLGRSEGTVKTHLHRGRMRLAEVLGEEMRGVSR